MAGHASRQTDSPRSWMVCFASFITLTLNNGSYYGFGLLLPSLLKHFGQSNARTAWVGSLYISLAYIFGPLVTSLNNRFGFRTTAIAGGLILSVSLLASSFVDNFWIFFMLFSIMAGLGSGMSYHSSLLVVLRHFVKWRSLAVGIMASTSSVGMFVMTQITEELVSNYGLKNAIRGWAILFFLATPLACSYDSRFDVEEAEKISKSFHSSHLLRNGRFVVYLVSISLVFFVVFTPSIFLAKFCESELGISTERASMLYTYMAIAFFFSNHFLCKISEFEILNIFDLYQITTTCLGICLLALPLVTSYKAVVAFAVLYGLMDGGRYGLMPLIVLECVGQKRTDQAWGYVSFCVGLCTAIGPVVVGIIADVTHVYAPAFYSAGGVMIFGSSLVFLTRFIKQEDLNEEKREELHDSLEGFVCERETVL